MASIYRLDAVEIAKNDAESGYKSNGHWNKYAEELDKYDFFAGCGKKNGAVDHCAIGYCWWLFKAVKSDGEEIDGNDRKYLVHHVMFQSDACCTSAGCTQQAQAYKDAGAWYENPKDLIVGDQIFFKKSNAKNTYYHTGMCTDWNAEGAFVSECNVDGGYTKTRFYKFSEFGGKIGGFGRPKWDGDTAPKNEPVKPEEPKKEITPDNSEKPSETNTGANKSIDELANEVIDGKWGNGEDRADRLTEAGYDYQAVQNRVNQILYPEKYGKTTGTKYTVRVNTKLNVRTGAGTEYPIVKQLSNGTSVTVTEKKNNFGKINTDQWVCLDYLV